MFIYKNDNFWATIYDKDIILFYKDSSDRASILWIYCTSVCRLGYKRLMEVVILVL